MARISTHVLDIAQGKPAAGLRVDLRSEGNPIRSAVTNGEGRTGEPLLSGDEIPVGWYELVFHAESYLPEPRFFGEIAIRFLVDDPHGNYHVPLLLAPHGYSTYRGS